MNTYTHKHTTLNHSTNQTVRNSRKSEASRVYLWFEKGEELVRDEGDTLEAHAHLRHQRRGRAPHNLRGDVRGC